MKTIILLLALTLGVCFGEPGDAEWKKENEKAWTQVDKEFPDMTRAEKIRIFKEYNELAKTENIELYNNPWKPVIFLRMEADVQRDVADKIAQQNARAQAQREAAELERARAAQAEELRQINENLRALRNAAGRAEMDRQRRDLNEFMENMRH